MSEPTPGSPAVSVIIPAASADDDLLAQIRAVSAQDLDASFETVVVLNSTDERHAGLLADVVAGGDRPVVVVQAADRRGAAYARNQGVLRSSAPVLAFCDADDIVRPDWLRHLVSAVTVNTAVGFKLV